MRVRFPIVAAVSDAAVFAAGALLLVSLLSFPERLRCFEPIPLVLRGAPTGYAECANGLVSRPARLRCPSFLPRAQETVRRSEREPVDPSRGECRFDRDCTRAAHGYCVEPLPAGRPVCAYGCVNDSECPEGICVCGDPVGHCAPASCKTDGDCEAPAVCGRYSRSPGCSADDGFACQQPADACAGYADCAPRRCGWDQARRVRVCTAELCTN